MTPHTLRPGAADDRAAWTRAVFGACDYAGAAMFGDPSTWQHHAALAMLRGDAAAFTALQQWRDPEARLHLGAALWIRGDEGAARRVLAGVDLPHAQNLLRMLERPRIMVLAQLPWMRGTVNDLLAGISYDPRFLVRNVSNHPLDIQQHPYASVQGYLDADFAPDFYVAAMVEWHHLPPDLQTLGCPILGHVADHDLHVQTLEPWLSLFDELVVTDRTEWIDVQGLGGRPVSSFPKVFGLPTQSPLPNGPRPLDFFVSGTMLDPFHPDKAAYMHEVLSLPDLTVRIVRGFAGSAAYDALLGASKASFTYVRRPGAMPTRGLEALAMGCAVALQEESILNLWVGEKEGVATYGPGRGELARCLRKILGDWRHYGPAAQLGAQRVRAEFDLRRVGAQYLRYCAFRAAAPRPERRLVDTQDHIQSRVSVSRTCLPESPTVRRRTMQANFQRLRDVLERAPSPRPIAAMARELLCEFAWYHQKRQAGHDEQTFFTDAVHLLEKGIRLWPDRLVLRFDLARALLCYGDADVRLRGWQLAWDTLEADTAWLVDPLDDVLPFDFDGECFDHRGYLDLVTRACRGEAVPTAAFVKPMLAALAAHLARKTGRIDLHERAVALDPGFARYRGDLAEALLAGGDPAARGRAIALLEELARGSTEFPRATARLLELAAAGETVDVDVVPARRLAEDTLDAAVHVRELFTTDRRAPARARMVSSVLAGEAASLRVAVLVPDPGAPHELASLISDLQSQSMAESLEIVVAVPAGQTAIAAVLDSHRDGRTAVRGVAAIGGYSQRLDACVRAASAPMLTLAWPGDRFRVDACDLLCRELEAGEDVMLVTANDGMAGQVLSDFRPEAMIAVRCLRAVSAERLTSGACLGLHPMWRRSLHDRHGGFAAALDGDPERVFFARALLPSAVRQRREVLVGTPAGTPYLQARSARTADARWLDAGLVASVIGQEARYVAAIGMMTTADANAAAGVESFYGTAVAHGDLQSALLMLRACVTAWPGLVTGRLAAARLLDAMALPGGDAVLRDGLAISLQADALRRHLVRYATRTTSRSEEPEPCRP